MKPASPSQTGGAVWLLAVGDLSRRDVFLGGDLLDRRGLGLVLLGEDGVAVRGKDADGLSRAGFHAGGHGLAVGLAPVAAQIAAHGDGAGGGFFAFGRLDAVNGREGHLVEVDGAVGAGVHAHLAGHAELGMHGDDAVLVLHQRARGADVDAGGREALVAAHGGLVVLALDHADAGAELASALHGLFHVEAVVGGYAGDLAAAAGLAPVGAHNDFFTHLGCPFVLLPG